MTRVEQASMFIVCICLFAATTGFLEAHGDELKHRFSPGLGIINEARVAQENQPSDRIRIVMPSGPRLTVLLLALQTRLEAQEDDIKDLKHRVEKAERRIEKLRGKEQKKSKGEKHD